MSADLLNSLQMNEERFLALLDKVIGESEFVQNNPPSLIPQEDRVCKHVLDVLRPYTKENGGPLIVEHVTYVEGRGNVCVHYLRGSTLACARWCC
jgi:acetylornithine deacetylase